ncbi:YbaB/EbfC family nucleoid-associated protein [Nocardia wallacei]|uniref:YbaB/EbfC family nucleoid-associated protein n=1 Tax=Nocardia wallacei TaxID=480035 RepID=UPI0024558EF8|nr:YbaB/EbfC family nucleoid-associated protein [Nocardia wallacei]
MTNEHAKAEMAAVLDGVREQLRTISRIQQERTRLMATATVRKRVTVTVNADGTVIETKLAAGVEDLTYPELAKAFTEAAQQAAAEAARKGQELMMPLHDQRARLPKLTDLIEDMPDLSAETPPPPPVSTAPPGAPERAEEPADALRYTDVEAMPSDGERDRRVTDSGW